MFRSQSGPGGLSINTTSANSLSGQSSLPPPSGSSQSKPLFGASTTNTQTQQGSSLFGNTQNQAPTNQQQQGGLFGNQATQGASGGLFGSQQSQQPAGGLFGLNNAQQSQSQPSGGVFGSTLGQNQTQQPNNTLFGGGATSQFKSSLFGNSQNATQTQSSLQQQPPPSIFSTTIGQHTQQQQTVPGVRISLNELRPTTRFNDLHEELQKAVEYVDRFILNKINWQEECSSASERINDMCEEMPPDVEYCAKHLATLQQALENDAGSIDFAKNLVKADAADAKLSFKVIQNLKLPQQFHHTNLWSTAMATQNSGPAFSDENSEEGASRNIVEYFSKQTEGMSKILESHKRNLAEVENYLKGIESNTLQQMQQMMFSRGRDGSAKSAEDQVRELAAVLREFENGVLGVAAKVGGAREIAQDVMLGDVGDAGSSHRRHKRFGAV